MFIGIRLEPNGVIYIAKEIYQKKLDDNLVTPVSEYNANIDIFLKPPYNFKRIEIDDMYADCINQDFNEDLTFNVEKYNIRKQNENNQSRKSEIRYRLQQLSQDLIQAQAGAVFDDLESRKLEFQTLHNELRVLEGKEPREYIS